MKSKKSSIKLGEKARDSSTNQSRNDHCVPLSPLFYYSTEHGGKAKSWSAVDFCRFLASDGRSSAGGGGDPANRRADPLV